MIEICYKRSRQDNVEAMLQHSKGLELCSSQPARDWKSCAFYFFIFLFWSSFFGLKIIIPFLSRLSFFIVCSFLFFPPLAFSFFFPLLRKWSLVLGHCHQSFFSNPFRFFSFCFLSVLLGLFFLPLPWKLSLEIIKRSFFSNPSRFFSFFVSFWLCFPPLPWKLTLEIIKRSFSSNPFRFFPCFFHLCIFFRVVSFPCAFSFFFFRFFLSCFMFILLSFFGFGYLSSFAIKIDLGNSQKELFLEPFSCFFRCFFLFWLFVPLCLQDWPWKLSKGAFSRTLLFFFPPVFFRFFHLCFRLFFPFFVFFFIFVFFLRIFPLRFSFSFLCVFVFIIVFVFIFVGVLRYMFVFFFPFLLSFLS